MNKIVNARPGVLVLPQSKLILKPKEIVEVEKLTDELQQALSKGWVENVNEVSSMDKLPTHDWEIDYSQVDDGKVIITDKVTGRRIEGEIAERKGEQYFTLKEIGTVKKQQFWPKAQALEHFDGSD